MSKTTIQIPKVVHDLFDRRIAHPRIQEVIREIEVLSALGSKSILTVVGPTGVGKSTLACVLESSLLKKYEGLMADNPGCVPVLRIEARATSEADFNWRLFYESILDVMQCGRSLPAVHYGVNDLTNRVEKPRGSSKNTVVALRTQVERSLRALGVKHLLIDESGHLTNVSDSKVKRQTDTLKSLANCTDCQIVLFGAYDVLGVSRLSAQLARRVREIHFARYREDSADDRLAFNGYLNHLEESSNGFFQGVLIRNADILFKNTLGCVGTLMGVLRELVSRAERTGVLSNETVQKSMLNHAQHRAILEEIKEGELKFSRDFVRGDSSGNRGVA